MAIFLLEPKKDTEFFSSKKGGITLDNQVLVQKVTIYQAKFQAEQVFNLGISDKRIKEVGQLALIA